jgi:hypothetical protein
MLITSMLQSYTKLLIKLGTQYLLKVLIYYTDAMFFGHANIKSIVFFNII